MRWQEITWQVPLHERPVILQMDMLLFSAQEVLRFQFEELWRLHLYGFSGMLRMDGIEYPILPGHIALIPPGASTEMHSNGMARVLYAHFKLPANNEQSVRIPAMFDYGGEFIPMLQSFEVAMDVWDENHLRAEVRLWDLLWQLASRGEHPSSSSRLINPTVERALEIIEIRLRGSISVADIADELELSQVHLTRLFRAATGMTINGYIQHRRVMRARHLLQYSSLTVKAIAAEVGIPDLQQFNKLIRRSLGIPPSAVRRHHA